MATPHALPCKLSLDDLVFSQQRLDAPTTPQREVFRIRIVLLAHQRYTNQQIARFLSCQEDTVRKWRNRFARCGFAGLRDAPRPGRPRAWSPLQVAAVVALVCEYVAASVAPAATPTLPGIFVCSTADLTSPMPPPLVVTTADALPPLPPVAEQLPPAVPPPEPLRLLAPPVGMAPTTPPPKPASSKPALPKRAPRAVVHLAELRHLVTDHLQLDVKRSTLWRLLNDHALKPWQFRYWIFPRDPHFAERAGPVLDLYARCWQGQPLGDDEYVLGGDEKTSIQARIRRQGTVGAKPGRKALVEVEYERGGALQYLALRDVHSGQVFGRCEAKTGIVPFDRLVAEVMAQEPYRSARRVFLIVDNGSSHRGQASVRRLQERHPNLVLVHLPVHASWLNQVEIYFSILQRLLLQPNDFPSLTAVAEAILQFQARYNKEQARPFAWHFGRKQLQELLAKLRRFPLPTPKPRKKRKAVQAPPPARAEKVPA